MYLYELGMYLMLFNRKTYDDARSRVMSGSPFDSKLI